jgi:hypothetical protein
MSIYWLCPTLGDPPFLDLRFYRRLAARPTLRRQSFDTASTIRTDPAPDRLGADVELLTDQGSTIAFLKEELDDPETELDGVGPRPGTFPIPSHFQVFGVPLTGD